jgi:hypothetical protein
MHTTLILGLAAMGLVLAVLAALVVGIRQEPSSQADRASATPDGRDDRRLVGVHVRRPEPSLIPDKQCGRPSHTATIPVRRPD